MVGPSESKSKTSSSAPDSKANRVVVTKASSSGKPSNRVVIGSLPEAITPSRLKELLQGIGPIQVDTASALHVGIGFSLIETQGCQKKLNACKNLYLLCDFDWVLS